MLTEALRVINGALDDIAATAVTVEPGVAPEQTGVTRRSFTAEITRPSALTGGEARVRVQVSVKGAPDVFGGAQDFEYPAYLDEVDVIRPNAQNEDRLLTFFIPAVGWRSVPEVVNKHVGWFSRDYRQWLENQINEVTR